MAQAGHRHSRAALAAYRGPHRRSVRRQNDLPLGSSGQRRARDQRRDPRQRSASDERVLQKPRSHGKSAQGRMDEHRRPRHGHVQRLPENSRTLQRNHRPAQRRKRRTRPHRGQAPRITLHRAMPRCRPGRKTSRRTHRARRRGPQSARLRSI